MNTPDKKYQSSRLPTIPSVESPMQSGAGKAHHAERGGGTFVSLFGLIKKNRTIFFDSSVIDSCGMQVFVNNNRKTLLSNNGCIKIPAFEWQLIGESSKVLSRYLQKEKVVSIFGDSNIKDYKTLLKELGGIYKEKWQLCFIVNESTKKQAILSAAKNAGIFIQILQLTKEGNIAREPQCEHSKSANKPKKFTIAQTPEKLTVAAIKPRVATTSGCIVIDSNGQKIYLKDQKLIHPNGISYATDRTDIWVKIFNANSLNTYTIAKIMRMLQHKNRCKGVCWPIDIVCDVDGNPVGYILPASKGYPLHLSLFKQAKLQKFFPNWNKKDICEVTLTILKIIQYLHDNNILLGCLNPAAIHIVSKDEVYFLDTDNYQIEGFPTLVYNNSFTPPELFGRKIYLCNKANENYAVAMLVFMIMMPGKTPYVIDSGKSVEDALKTRKFPFSYGSVHSCHTMPGAWRFMWSHLTPLKEVFYNTFEKGAKFDEPKSRKDVGSWIGTVSYFKKELENPVDRESLKLNPTTFKKGKDDRFYKCKFCGVEHPKFYFDSAYFDSDNRICNSCIDKKSDVSFTCQVCKREFFYTNRTALFHKKKKSTDSNWKDQKYCHDCKSKTIKCSDCGKEVEYYQLVGQRCKPCHDRYRNSPYKYIKCKECGATFTLTIGQHEFYKQKNLSEPGKCEACREKKKKSNW